MKIKKLYIYPIKSTRGISLEKADVLETGFRNDRCVAVVDERGKIVTGREHPKLVQLITSITGNGELVISLDKQEQLSFLLPFHKDSIEVKLFRNKVSGKAFNKAASDWISDYLKGDFRLLYLGDEFNSVISKRGGKEGEFKGFSDSSPIHLINLGTLNYLNSKLKSKVGERNFRPNIVIDAPEPFEEDSWSTIEINKCLFRVQEHTNRCLFTTIDPETSKKNKNMQPLAQLAELRMKMGMRPTFGIGLVPLNNCIIGVGDAINSSIDA